MKKIITIELDGVLNLYNGNYVEDKIPRKRQGAAEFLEKLCRYYEIEIHTTRNVLLVHQWLKDKGLMKYVSSVTNLKNHNTYIYVDNRAVRYRGHYDILLEDIKRFVPRG